MTEKIITVRCHDTADQQRQQHYLRVNALATALHNDYHPEYITAQQPAPYATPRGVTAGSALAARLLQEQAALETRYYALTRALRVGSVADIVDAGKRCEELEQQIARIRGMLAEIQEGRGYPCPNPNEYEVRHMPAEYLIKGEVFKVEVPRREYLNTHALPDDLRAALHAYLISGRRALPYSYKSKPQRIYESGKCQSADRELILRVLHFVK